MADKIKSALSNLVKSVAEENRTIPTQKVVPIKKKISDDVVFAFTLDKELILYLKELVLFKKSSDNAQDYFFNESEAVREGIKLMQNSYSHIKPRPEDIGVPTWRGRGQTTQDGVIKVNTSFLISKAERNFVYDFIYHEQKGGSRFTKEEFMILLIEELERKYQIKKEAKK